MSTFFSKYDLIRKHFGKFTAKTAVSPLAAFYKKSYDEFLQLHKQPHEREEYGLESLLRRIFPIECRKLTQDREDLPNTHQREIYFYSHYVVSTPILTEEECRMKGGSYFGTIHIVTFKVTLRDDRPLNHDVSIDKVDYLQKHTFTLPLRGIPLMTEQGTFLVNGIERAILAQLQRCPGTYASKRDDYVSLKVIPYYGSNIQFEIGKAGKIFVRLMGKRRIPLYLFLSSLGISSQEIISLFFNPCLVRKNAAVEVLKSSTHQANLRIAYDIKRFQFGFATRNIYDARTGKLRIREGEEINKDLFVKILSSSLLNHTLTKEMMNSLSYFETPVLSSVKSLEESEASIQGVGHFLSLAGVRVQNSSLLEERQVYISTKSSPRSKYAFYYSPESASWKKRIIESVHEYQAQDSLTSFSRMIHLMRGNKSANYLCTERERDELIRRMMLDPVHFNLSHFGRAQMNDALQLPSNMYHGILTKIDIYSLVLSLLKKVYHIASEDNLYQLQNRKVRLPGELLGHILLKSFLQIKRKKDFSSKFQALPFDFKTLVYKDTLPAFVRSRMIQSFLLNLYNTKEVSSRARNKWLEYRSFIYYDSTDKLAQILLPLAKRQIEGFLTGSNLSQLLDQLNPLSELTHLRRLSLLGPDGLNKDNVSLDTRDVQSSFFGRICPIETPEGKAVGIVNSMAIFSKLDEQGDLLTPYLCVRNGYLQTEVHYLSSKKEPDHAIALLEESVNPTMELRNSLIYCKYKHQFVYLEKHLVEYIDVSPKQMLSLSSSLIPFLEHNDGNRALMGSNMQRQAVPSLVKELSFIGTGSEDCIANQELQESVLYHSLSWQDNLSLFYTFDSKKSTRLPLFEKSLVKFEKANQKSYKSESPRGIVGDTFTSSQKVLDMTGTKEGQLSIGHNMTIGFMSMNGYSFEDSIVISDRLLKDSLFSSMHTKELVVLDWEIQQSPHERITRNIPNTEEKDIRYLDEDGIVKAGSPLSGGDILVGKVFVRSRKTMKMDDKEEFLQGLLLGEKKELIRDISERAPMDIEGSVLDVKKYYTLPEQEISTRYYRKKIQMAQQAYIVRSMLLQHHFLSMFFNALDQHPKGFVSLPAFLTLQEFYQDGVLLDNAKNIAPLWKKARSLAHLVSQSSNISWTSTIIKKLFEDKNIPQELARSLKKALLSYLRLSLELRLAWYRKHILPLSKLAHSSSSLKMVKVLVAYRHKLKPGDKMTGRHGNKGVVSQVVPMQDMPYTSDGLSMDIILNPIGISSRMNLGQVFEVHLGLAAAELGKKIKKLLRLQNSDHQYIDLRNFLYHIYGDTKEQRILSKLNESQIRSLLQKILRGVPMATIPFSGASEMDVKDYLQMANLDPRGQVDIYDGKTGEKFDRKITTGTMYVLKLNHLVDDKIHSRFTGPYNRITEQPLGGKSLHGGQRFGEMEVWALQAYGAAYTLLDMTTVKSDSRMSKMTSLPMYKNQRFKQKSKRTFPEAFNVLLRELWCLGLLVRVS
jgi:DNA-directed RNA polymerase subunit beta